ncbi:MAG: MFS transporter [Pseudanabaena sp. ELA607]
MTSSNAFLQVLQNRAFLFLWIAQLLSQLADKILIILLIAIATSANYQDYPVPVNTRESLVLIATTLPAVFLGSIAGIFADRYPKRLVMFWCNVLRAAILFLLPFLPNSLILLLAVTFLISVLTNFFAPAEQSAIPLVVNKADLMPANALFTITMMASLIIGFAIGSPLLNWVMHLSVITKSFAREMLLGLIYTVSGLCILVLPQDEVLHPNLAKQSVIADLKDGLAYVRQHHLIGGAMVQLILLYSVLGAMQKLSLNFAELLTNNRDEFGFFVAATGIGLAIGALILGQFGQRFAHRPLPLIGFWGMAVSFLCFALVNKLWLGLIVCLFLGFHSALVAIPMQTAIQEHTPEQMRGKVFGLLNNGENIAVSLPLALAAVALDVAAGWLGKQVGFQVVMVVCSLLVLALGNWAWQHTRRDIEPIL